jgi:hypothetical protein
MKARVLGLLAMCMLTAEAGAQQRDPAAAQALFDEATALMKSKNFVKACPKLAESQRLDPGIGTQFHLAECYEGQGLTASAWAQFLEVASLAGASGQADRQQAARKRAAKLEPRLARLRINVPVAKRITGVHVERDGIAVQEVSWESALPVDPGEHELTVSAAGYKTFVTKVNAREGQTSEVDVPQLEAAPAAAPAASAAPAAAVPAAPSPSSPPPEVTPKNAPAGETPPSSSGIGAGAIVLGTVGVVGLGVGTVFGLMARSKFQDSKAECSQANEDRCSAAGIKLRDDSIVLANVSTIGFIAGGVALGTAGIILLTRGSSKPTAGAGAGQMTTSVQAGPSQGSIVLTGRF